MRCTSKVNLKQQQTDLHLSLRQPCRTSTQLARRNPTKPTTRSLAGVGNLSKLPSTSMPRVSEHPQIHTHHHHLRDRSPFSKTKPNPKAPKPPPTRKRQTKHQTQHRDPSPGAQRMPHRVRLGAGRACAASARGPAPWLPRTATTRSRCKP